MWPKDMWLKYVEILFHHDKYVKDQRCGGVHCGCIMLYHVVSEYSITFQNLHNILESSDDGSLSPGCMPVRRYK